MPVAVRSHDCHVNVLCRDEEQLFHYLRTGGKTKIIFASEAGQGQ